MKIRTALRFALLSASALFCLSSFAFAQSKANDSDIPKPFSEMDLFFNNILAAQNYIGLGACLVKDDKIIWKGAYGYSELESKKQLTANDIYQLASLSKVFTAAALMQLYEKGLFKLDDDINDYMPFKVRNPYFPDKPITFRMLLTHTAGFFDVLPNGNKISLGVWGDSDIPLSKYVEELFTPGGKYYSVDYFSRSEPGTEYQYSNISFSLIGCLVEKITQKDFSEYCRENIFLPLEMHDTGWHLKDIDTNRIVFGYGFPKNDSLPLFKKVRHFGMPGYPEGMLRTTMQDLSHFLIAFIHDGKYKNFQLLKPETVSLMLTPQQIKNIPSRAFVIKDIGLTWLIMDIGGEQFYSMNGFSGSIFTNAYFSRENKTAIIYFFTGITMKNMSGMIEITRELKNALKADNL